jgi:hypothetical protein
MPAKQTTEHTEDTERNREAFLGDLGVLGGLSF